MLSWYMKPHSRELAGPGGAGGEVVLGVKSTYMHVRGREQGAGMQHGGWGGHLVASSFPCR